MRFLSSFFVLLTMVACSNENDPSKHGLKQFETKKDSHPNVKSADKPIIDTVSKTSIKDNKSRVINNSIAKNISEEELLTEDFSYLSLSYIDGENQIIRKNSASIKGQKLVFAASMIEKGDSRVGCSSNSTLLSFEVVNENQSDFVIKDSELKSINFSYTIDGGLLIRSGKDPYRGTIKCQKNNDEWNIEIDVFLDMQDYTIPENQPVQYHLIYKGIYK